MSWRPMMRQDRPYVVNTWAKSAHYPGLTLRQTFKLVDRLLDSKAVRVWCLVTGKTVHAWVAGEAGGRILHYVYVPPELRRQGVAKRAITALFGTYPDRIDTTHDWPLPDRSGRFRYLPDLKDAA